MANLHDRTESRKYWECIRLIHFESLCMGALLGTSVPALATTLLTGVRNGSLLHPLDAAETALLLLPITAVSCGTFGLLAGIVGGTAIYLRRRRVHSSKRLLVESAISGFLMSCLFPFFDAAVNSLFLRSFQLWVIPGQIILYPVLGIPCALTRALVVRKYFIRQDQLSNKT
jgi:hypothetical protein